MYRAALPLLLAATLGLALPAAAQNSLGIGYVERTGTQAADGKQQPPWTKVRVLGGFVALPAKTMLKGDATILPYDPALPAITLAIQKLHPYQREECTGEMSKTRNVEFPDVSNEAYRSYVRTDAAANQGIPTQVLIVHPAAPNAKTLPKQSVAPGDIPKGYPLNTLQAAFDVTGIGKAEIVELFYCCRNPQTEKATCEKAAAKLGGTMCTGLFRRTKAGWRQIYRQVNEDC